MMELALFRAMDTVVAIGALVLFFVIGSAIVRGAMKPVRPTGWMLAAAIAVLDLAMLLYFGWLAWSYWIDSSPVRHLPPTPVRFTYIALSIGAQALFLTALMPERARLRFFAAWVTAALLLTGGIVWLTVLDIA